MPEATIFSSRYREEIDEFFKGKDYYENDRAIKGHIWVCRHGLFDTLTVEPPEGGQYEIAIRIKVKGNPWANPKAIGMEEDEWAGYYAIEGFFAGHNTDGH